MQTILVVEDDVALLEGVRDMLELAGYRVLTACHGQEALQVLETHPQPDLIISDIMMPRMNGYAFYEAVRARPEWVAIPFIFLTALGEKSDVRLGKQLGADDYIVKPFDEEDLLVAVNAKLRRSAQLQAAQEQQVSSLKHSILTMLNHEFRTPLTLVTSYTEMISESGGKTDTAEFEEFLRGIRKGSDRLRRLVEDFIFLVELESGEARKVYEWRRTLVTDLPALIEAAVAPYRGIAASRGLGLVVDVPQGLPPLLADVEYLEDALRRLLDNACKFSQQGVIRVTAGLRQAVPTGAGEAEGQRDWVNIAVSDQGIGIAAEELPRIFEAFYQSNREKLEQQGSGSGLAIVKGIVEMHGGQVEVESQPGVGSTFTIVLPVAGQEQPPQASP
jgi:two-component system sensor histidine kinase/response regulator